MKTRFNIYLYEGSTIITVLVLAAAYSNGGAGKNKKTLKELQTYIHKKYDEYDAPIAKSKIEFKTSIVENKLLADITYKDENKTVCACEIEEVEINELVGYEESTNKFINDINNPDDLKDVL